ncbi:hypothetical protein FQN54_003438 [Arachnomyces sp. PD_36]|nr:hypothetical protein FQN54_003438 [Arachnomyces sp. PD_36]
MSGSRLNDLPSTQGTIYDDKFWGLSDEDAVRSFASSFVPELERLKRVPEPAESASSGKKPCSNQSKPSYLLFNEDYPEVNRTMVGLLALKWIMSGDYESFTRCQAEVGKLRVESFTRLRNLFSQCLQSQADILTLITAMMINDLGKDPLLAGDIATVTGKPLQSSNHDTLVYAAAEAGMVTCIKRLDAFHNKDIMLGLECGSGLNVAQLAQAESVPGSLQDVLILKGHPKAFDIKLLEVLLDVAGAAGHVDSRCAEPMTEAVFQGFMTSRDALLGVIDGSNSLRAAYDSVLTTRGNVLEEAGFRKLAMNDPSERALLRLLTMGRTTDKEQAEWFAKAFADLPSSVRENLVNGLNVDGYLDGEAILPYYTPALFSEALKNSKDQSAQAKQAVLGSLMRFLAGVYGGSKPTPGQPGSVVERNLIFAKEYIRTEAFRMDPTILDRVAMPRN